MFKIYHQHDMTMTQTLTMSVKEIFKNTDGDNVQKSNHLSIKDILQKSPKYLTDKIFETSFESEVSKQNDN